MAVTSAVGDLVASIYELFASFVGAIVSLVQGLFNMIAGFVGGLVHLVRDVFAGVFRAVGGLGNFVFGGFSFFILPLPPLPFSRSLAGSSSRWSVLFAGCLVAGLRTMV